MLYSGRKPNPIPAAHISRSSSASILMSCRPADPVLFPRATFSVEFAIQTFEITLIFKLLETDERPLSETMLLRNDGHHPLAKKWDIMQAEL